MPTCVMSGEVRNAVQHTTQLWGRRWRVRGRARLQPMAMGPQLHPTQCGGGVSSRPKVGRGACAVVLRGCYAPHVIMQNYH